MRKRASALAVFAALAAAPAALAQTDRPAPGGALAPSEKALEIVFTGVCLPAMLNRQPVEPLALGRGMRPISAASLGERATAADRAWRLPPSSGADVVAWADGTCSSRVKRGDPAVLEKRVLRALKAEGLSMTPGPSIAVGDNGIRQAWCNQEARPFVVAITKKTGWGRSALVTTAFWARGINPGFCGRQGGLGQDSPSGLPPTSATVIGGSPVPDRNACHTLRAAWSAKYPDRRRPGEARPETRRAQFQRADIDCDGGLTVEEYVAMEWAASAHWDTNGDEKISRAEYMAQRCETSSPGDDRVMCEKVLASDFRWASNRVTGIIDLRTFRRDKVRRFRAADLNRDGVLTLSSDQTFE